MSRGNLVSIGDRFGRWTVIGSYSEMAPSRGGRYWLCRCDCGTERKVLQRGLRFGSQSCGCRRVEATTTHGATRGGNPTPTFRIWNGMIQRCATPSAGNYRLYGGRGISVCERWRSFENFLADMGERPSKRHSIERIDVNGNYEPGNCRWATTLEQNRNRRKSSRSGKLNEHQVRRIREMYIAGHTQKSLAPMFGVSRGMISMICAGKTWAL